MKKGLSRRDFLKVSAAGALGVATMGAQVAMAQEDEKKEAAVKPSVPGVSGVLDRAKLEKKAWNDPNVLLKVRWSGVKDVYKRQEKSLVCLSPRPMSLSSLRQRA